MLGKHIGLNDFWCILCAQDLKSPSHPQSLNGFHLDILAKSQPQHRQTQQQPQPDSQQRPNSSPKVSPQERTEVTASHLQLQQQNIINGQSNNTNKKRKLDESGASAAGDNSAVLTDESRVASVMPKSKKAKLENGASAATAFLPHFYGSCHWVVSDISPSTVPEKANGKVSVNGGQNGKPPSPTTNGVANGANGKATKNPEMNGTQNGKHSAGASMNGANGVNGKHGTATHANGGAQENGEHKEVYVQNGNGKHISYYRNRAKLVKTKVGIWVIPENSKLGLILMWEIPNSKFQAPTFRRDRCSCEISMTFYK